MRGALQAQLRKLFPGCAGKARYPSKAAADADVEIIMKANEAEQKETKSLGLNVYRCRTCYQWHIGRDRARPVV